MIKVDLCCCLKDRFNQIFEFLTLKMMKGLNPDMERIIRIFGEEATTFLDSPD